MKKNLLYLLAILLLGSCKTSNDFSQRKYFDYFYAKKGSSEKVDVKKNTEDFLVANNDVVPEQEVAKQEETIVSGDEPVLASVEENKVYLKKSKAVTKSAVTKDLTSEQIKPAPFNAYRTLKEIKKANKQTKVADTVPFILLVILAILLPPVAVFLVDGIGTPFWISVLLTLLFYLPGIIYALYIVFTKGK